MDKMDRPDTVDQQETVAWEGEEQVVGSLVLQWVEGSKVSEVGTEDNNDFLEVWVAE